MNPLLAPIEFPVRVADRTLRNLDAIAAAARSLPRAITLLERLDERAEQMLALGERIDARAESILTLGQSIESRSAELVDLGGQFNEIGERMLSEARKVHERAAEVVTHADAVVAVLPSVRRAVELGEPLEGAIERFARVVDRLPGAPPRRPPDVDAPNVPE